MQEALLGVQSACSQRVLVNITSLPAAKSLLLLLLLPPPDDSKTPSKNAFVYFSASSDENKVRHQVASSSVSQIANHFVGSFNAAIAASAANGEVWVAAWARSR